jgi:hypothetical protein
MGTSRRNTPLAGKRTSTCVVARTDRVYGPQSNFDAARVRELRQRALGRESDCLWYRSPSASTAFHPYRGHGRAGRWWPQIPHVPFFGLAIYSSSCRVPNLSQMGHPPIPRRFHSFPNQFRLVTALFPRSLRKHYLPSIQ